MFTLKLANNETFPVTAAEHFLSKTGNGKARGALRVESAPAQHGLEWYLEKLSAPGAIDTVQVLCEDGSVGLETEGYTEISNAGVRLLVTGEKSPHKGGAAWWGKPRPMLGGRCCIIQSG